LSAALGVSVGRFQIAHSDVMIFKIRCAILRTSMSLNICVAALFLFSNALEEVKIRFWMDLFYKVG
jgi:hypothetical protein